MFKGNSIAQIINVVGAIFLAKLYGPESYGIFAVYLSISGILSILNTLQLDYGIVTSNDSKKSKNLFNSLLIFSFAISLLLLLIFEITKQIGFWEKYDSSIVLLSIMGALIISNNKIFESYLTKVTRFKQISNAKIILSLVAIIFQFIFYLIFKDHGLILGSLTGLIIVCMFYSYLNFQNFQTPSFQQFTNSFKENKNLIRFALPSNFLNAIGLHIMPILILAFFSKAESGTYALSIKILATPLFLISSSISQVYFQKSTDLYQKSKKELYNITWRIVKNNVFTIFLILLFTNTIGTKLLSYIFTEKWDNLPSFMLILSMLVLARSSFNPISHLIIVTNKNHIGFIFNIYLLTVNLLALAIGVQYSNIIYTIIILSVFGAIGYMLLLLYFLNFLKKQIINNEKNHF